MGFLTSVVMVAVIGGSITWTITRSRKLHRRLGRQLAQNGAHLRAPQVHQESRQGRQETRTAAAEHSCPWSTNRETASSDSTAVIMMDRFEHIEGIEPAFARRLNQAGILTYADLAAQLPERVQAIVSPDKSRDLQVRDWIAQACALADGDACYESDNAS